MPLAPIPLERLRKVGVGLKRPEDVVVARDGRVWASDQASACAEVLPGGGLRRVGMAGGAPNGISMDTRGRRGCRSSTSGRITRHDHEHKNRCPALRCRRQPPAARLPAGGAADRTRRPAQRRGGPCGGGPRRAGGHRDARGGRALGHHRRRAAAAVVGRHDSPSRGRRGPRAAGGLRVPPRPSGMVVLVEGARRPARRGVD